LEANFADGKRCFKPIAKKANPAKAGDAKLKGLK
jgi:hypothetical protein